MNMKRFFDQVGAARRLSVAFESGATPRKADLATLGLPADMKQAFKR